MSGNVDLLEKGEDMPKSLTTFLGACLGMAAPLMPQGIVISSLPVHRLQACITTDERVDAGTNSDVWVDLNVRQRHFIDTPADDFEGRLGERCFDLPFDFMTNDSILRATDLHTVHLGMDGTDDWCVKTFRLILNGSISVPIFDRPAGGCHWLGDDNPPDPPRDRMRFEIDWTSDAVRAGVERGLSEQRRIYERGGALELDTTHLILRFEARLGHRLQELSSMSWDGNRTVSIRQVDPRGTVNPRLDVQARVVHRADVAPGFADADPIDAIIRYRVDSSARGVFLTQIDVLGSGDAGLRRRLAEGALAHVKIGGRPLEQLFDETPTTVSSGGPSLLITFPTLLFTIAPVGTNLFVDAFQEDSFAVVAVEAQNNDSQRWILTRHDEGKFSLQQASTRRFMDAFQEDNGFAVVTRPAQGNDTQKWILTREPGDVFTLQQVSTGRFVDGLEESDPLALVTRESLAAETQRWRFFPVRGR